MELLSALSLRFDTHINILLLCLYNAFLVNGQPLGIYMAKEHNKRHPAVAPIKVREYENTTVLSLKAMLLGMLAYNSEERLRMDQVMVMIDRIMGKT